MVAKKKAGTLAGRRGVGVGSGYHVVASSLMAASPWAAAIFSFSEFRRLTGGHQAARFPQVHARACAHARADMAVGWVRGFYSYGLYSNGLYSNGLYSNGLYSDGL